MLRLLAPIAAAMLVLAARGTAAQTPPVDLSSFYHALTTGVGARAWGMGGTQIALADAAEAATWNPAAPAGTDRPAVLGVLSGDRLTGKYDPVRFALPSGPTGSITPGPTTASASRLQALQFGFPLRVAGRRLVPGIAYRRRLSLPDRTDADYLFRNQSLYRFDYDYSYQARGSGGFDTIGVSVAADLGRGIRAGATVHRWFGTVSSSYLESYRYSVANYYGWDGSWNEGFGDDLRLEMSGVSVDLGAQFAARDRYFVGVVFRSRTSADVEYSNAATHDDSHTSRSAAAEHSGRGTLTLPASFGAGAAVRITDRLTVAADATWAFWSAASLDGYARATALGDVPQATALAYPAQTPAGLQAQSDTGRASAGLEYCLTLGPLRIPLRAGVSYQQAYDNTSSSSVAATAGAGGRWRGLVLDAAWVRETASGRYTRQSLLSSVGWTF